MYCDDLNAALRAEGINARVESVPQRMSILPVGMLACSEASHHHSHEQAVRPTESSQQPSAPAQVVGRYADEPAMLVRAMKDFNTRIEPHLRHALETRGPVSRHRKHALRAAKFAWGRLQGVDVSRLDISRADHDHGYADFRFNVGLETRSRNRRRRHRPMTTGTQQELGLGTAPDAELDDAELEVVAAGLHAAETAYARCGGDATREEAQLRTVQEAADTVVCVERCIDQCAQHAGHRDCACVQQHADALVQFAHLCGDSPGLACDFIGLNRSSRRMLHRRCGGLSTDLSPLAELVHRSLDDGRVMRVVVVARAAGGVVSALMSSSTNTVGGSDAVTARVGSERDGGGIINRLQRGSDEHTLGRHREELVMDHGGGDSGKPKHVAAASSRGMAFTPNGGAYPGDAIDADAEVAAQEHWILTNELGLPLC